MSSLSVLWGHNEAKISEKNEVGVGARRQLTKIPLKGSWITVLKIFDKADKVWKGVLMIVENNYFFFMINANIISVKSTDD